MFTFVNNTKITPVNVGVKAFVWSVPSNWLSSVMYLRPYLAKQRAGVGFPNCRGKYCILGAILAANWESKFGYPGKSWAAFALSSGATQEVAQTRARA